MDDCKKIIVVCTPPNFPSFPETPEQDKPPINHQRKVISLHKKRTKAQENNTPKKKLRRRLWRNRPDIRPPFKLDTIEDLLYIAWNYQGNQFDWFTLWNMIPALTELSRMIGMKKVKEKVIDLVTFYTQDLHMRETSDGPVISNKDLLHGVIYGPPGVGKCLGKDTPIIMKDGTVKMVQDIKVGDEIMGDDSTSRKILSVTSGTDMMYRISQEYGDDYIVNESHILSLKLSVPPLMINNSASLSYRIEWYDEHGKNIKTFSYENKDLSQLLKEAEEFAVTLPKCGSVIDISVMDYLEMDDNWKSVYKGYKTGVSYPHRETPIDPYVLGYWLGLDISDKPQLAVTNKGIVEEFLKVYPGSDMVFDGTNSSCDHVIEKEIDRFLLELGNLGLICNKNIPDLYLFNSEDVRKKLLAGLIDAGGNNIRYIFYEITQKNKNMALAIVTLSRSLGYKTTIDEVTKTCIYKGNKIRCIYQRISISNVDCDLPLKIERIIPKPNEMYGDLMYQIGVVQLSEGEYYGFEIDGNKRFLLGDFTVTHNTTLVNILAKIYCKMGCLPTEKVIVAKKTDFMGKWVGHSEEKTMNLLKSALGGVLLIDEAYSMGSKKIDSFSKGIIDLLNQFLTDHQGEFICIIAGYEDSIKRDFFASNDGLEGRFSQKFRIDSYTGEELSEMFFKKVMAEGWSIEEGSIVSSFFVENKKYFPCYGRDVDKFISVSKSKHSRRIFGDQNAKKKEFNLEDLKKGFEVLKEDFGDKKEELPSMMYG